nr:MULTISPECIES: aspartyl protease family protein [Myxococcaceae]
MDGKGPFRFLVDAGGNVVSVNRSVAQAAGLRVLYSGKGREVVQVQALELGSVRLVDVAAVVEPELDVDGVLGFNVFTEGLLTLDYPGRTLTWAAQGALPPADGRGIVDYALRERMPYVPFRAGARTLWFNLDTGARGDFYVPAAMESELPLRAPAKEGPRLWNQAFGTTDTRVGELTVPLELGAFREEHPHVVFSPELQTELLVGSGFLQRFALTFDLAHHRLRLTP